MSDPAIDFEPSEPTPPSNDTHPYAPGWITALACLVALGALTVAMAVVGEKRTLSASLEQVSSKLEKAKSAAETQTLELERWRAWRELAAAPDAQAMHWKSIQDSTTLRLSCVINRERGDFAMLAHEMPDYEQGVHLFAPTKEGHWESLGEVSKNRMLLRDSVDTYNWLDWMLAAPIGDSIPFAPGIVVGRPVVQLNLSHPYN